MLKYIVTCMNLKKHKKKNEWSTYEEMTSKRGIVGVWVFNWKYKIDWLPNKNTRLISIQIAKVISI